MMKKLNLFTSAAIIAGIGLTGCGGGTSSTDTSAGGTPEASTITVVGTAIDPELINATVCLDINNDENCTATDPSTHTDQNGQYALTLTQAQIDADYALLVMGGTDKATGEAFKGKLLADLNSSMQNITPLTTLLYTQLQGIHDEASQTVAKTQLETLLSLSMEALQANIVDLANQGYTHALKIALMLQKSAEALSPEDTLTFYKELAEKIHTTASHTEIETLIIEMCPDTIKADMITYIETLMSTHLTDAYAIAEEAHEAAVARGLDWENRIHDPYHFPSHEETEDENQTDNQNGSSYTEETNETNNTNHPLAF